MKHAGSGRSTRAGGRPGRGPSEVAGARGSRRRFLKLIAAGSAGLLAGAASGAAAPARRAKAARAKTVGAIAREGHRSKAVQAEIENQKKYLAKTLKTIRDYALLPGSEMAFAFRPIKAARGSKRGAAQGGRTG
jgi:hypothetical protein